MASLEDIFNHVALPPRLPGRQAAQLSLVEGALTQRMIDASKFPCLRLCSICVTGCEIFPRRTRQLVGHVMLATSDTPLSQPGTQSCLNPMLTSAGRVARDLTLDPEAYRVWDSVRLSLETCRTVNQAGRLNKASLLKAFRELGVQEILILHIAEQNAGLL